MSFKLFKLFFLLIILSCGMKGPPVAPKNSVLPSMTDQYLLQPTPTITPTATPVQ